MKSIIVALGALLLSSASLAGDFFVEKEDSATITVDYTGTVDYEDIAKWNELTERADGRIIFLYINSGGGYAYAGLDLYWLMEKYHNLVTIGGADYGAWSAAAIMWCAGDVRQLEEGGQVWFHAAYCQWDSTANPSIGCDTTDFQIKLIDVFEDAGFDGLSFNIWLNVVQGNFGTDGWIGIMYTTDDWFLYDSTDDFIFFFDEEVIKP